MTQTGVPLHGRPGQLPLPAFKVELAPPDLSAWLAGNTGIAGFTSYAAEAPGPHVLLLALMHGNELAGAIVLGYRFVIFLILNCGFSIRCLRRYSLHLRRLIVKRSWARLSIHSFTSSATRNELFLSLTVTLIRPNFSFTDSSVSSSIFRRYCLPR